MIITSTAKRYARALFELSKDNKCLDEVLTEFKDFLAIVEKDEALQLLLKLPNITRREQLLIQYLKDFYSEIFFNFILLVLKNNRYSLLRQIFPDYLSLYDKFNNRIKADVISAIPLPEDVSLNLIKTLKEQFNADVRIENKVDPSILGGFIIRIDGLVFDASIQEKFNKMKTHLITGEG
ncbi:ATP synthase F1 subunit delta [candidate division KSB1 bacterium]|nr:ATP synthase F1 subunit delta [candidate division KSB1 bacterium]MBL7093117.1 ATP synthase F1 subunit delta [candidate division KSB1 bacterium]